MLNIHNLQQQQQQQPQQQPQQQAPRNNNNNNNNNNNITMPTHAQSARVAHNDEFVDFSALRRRTAPPTTDSGALPPNEYIDLTLAPKAATTKPKSKHNNNNNSNKDSHDKKKHHTTKSTKSSAAATPNEYVDLQLSKPSKPCQACKKQPSRHQVLPTGSHKPVALCDTCNQG
jgi:hypothetical protein